MKYYNPNIARDLLMTKKSYLDIEYMRDNKVETAKVIAIVHPA